ncbi:WecB/TagA/CpsF family glycosyltransferase [Listeria kieliensis]|uniref:UDP-N-acetyl-D-mannosamine transferase n=1 Tax=Listeria kieliensis TaxID=1621700 RepID=A0A3D8TRH7_9LIST|nr:WecB/TagA/CpsF family glycosyltransferase [Listeria kieliensis]RDX01365.1 UDP-N-acetyl-D-mannosamine transferase [Listeria kieliensis]
MRIDSSKRISLLGTNIDCLTMDETLECIRSYITQKKNIQHVAVNAGKINLMSEDMELQMIVNQCPLINADGQSIVWAARFLGYKVPERVAGIDLFIRLVELAAQNKYRIFYFGAEESIVKKVVSLHQKKYPHMEIAGYRNGYFNENQSLQIAKEIADTKPDILFVAFSSPKKEKWIYTYKDVLQVPFSMGVGGSFDVIAGKTKRAPKWMQRTGLEWLYRFIQEPRRMYTRYLIGNWLFLKKVWFEKKQRGQEK